MTKQATFGFDELTAEELGLTDEEVQAYEAATQPFEYEPVYPAIYHPEDDNFDF